MTNRRELRHQWKKLHRYERSSNQEKTDAGSETNTWQKQKFVTAKDTLIIEENRQSSNLVCELKLQLKL